MRTFFGQNAPGQKAQADARERNPEAGQNRPKFVCAKVGPQARKIAPFPHCTGAKAGPKAFHLVAPWAKTPVAISSPANERAFRSLRGSEPRSTVHVVLKIVDLSGSDSPEHCDFCTVCLRSSRTSPLEGEALLGVAPTGALFRFK